jgi:hypothetical protein
MTVEHDIFSFNLRELRSYFYMHILSVFTNLTTISVKKHIQIPYVDKY